MVLFCEGIVEEIISASTETELKEVVSGSLSRFRTTKNSYNENSYITNMIVTLRATKREDRPEEAIRNIKIALEIFRQYQKQSPGLIL